MNNNYKIFVMVHDYDLAKPVMESLHPLNCEIFYAPGYPSFSKVVNDIIVKCDADIVVICSYKIRPTPHDIVKMLTLINDGYGFVALFRFACFGFKKELIRRIGFMDERFIGGGYEDDDFYMRLAESNISMYVTEEVDYKYIHSTWDTTKTQNIYNTKWSRNTETNTIYRNLPELEYTYNIGESDKDVHFKPLSESVAMYPINRYVNASYKKVEANAAQQMRPTFIWTRK